MNNADYMKLRRNGWQCRCCHGPQDIRGRRRTVRRRLKVSLAKEVQG